MKIKRLDPDHELFPLPPDYFELSEEGQREARVNACRQWMLKWNNEEHKAQAYVKGIQFFDMWYLQPDHEVGFDSMFYDMDPLPTPAMHLDIWTQWALHPLSITIAPRGSAKSFSVRKAILMEMLSRPKRSIVYATSSGDNTKNTGQSIKDQFDPDVNPRIHADWASEYGRNLRPNRGQAPWGITHLQLMNGSWLRCISAESKQRGMRPQLYVLDDPEFDAKASTEMQIVREYMDVLLFKMVLPMVMRAGASVRWLATFVSRRHYAWHAMSVDKDGRALDRRFERWARLTIRSEYTDAEDRLRSCWPEMWPPTREERLALAEDDPHYKDVTSLEEIKEMIGISNYLSEYMAKPGAGDEIFFPALTEERHGYWFEGWDPLFETNPRKSQTRICYWTEEDGEHKQVRIPLCEWLREVRLFAAVDTSFTAKQDSDSKVCNVMAVTSKNELFVLDLWSAKCHQPELVDNTLKICDKWKVGAIYVEAIKQGIGVYYELESIVNTRGREFASVDHLPAVKKFNPGQTAKTAKISALEPRFRTGLIKLPLRERNMHPWRNLCNQIEEFNPDAPDGGLAHDDELDTVSFSVFIVRGRLRQTVEVDDGPESPLERLERGEIKDENGLYHAHTIDWSRVSLQDVMDLVDRNTRVKHASRV